MQWSQPQSTYSHSSSLRVLRSFKSNKTVRTGQREWGEIRLKANPQDTHTLIPLLTRMHRSPRGKGMGAHTSEHRRRALIASEDMMPKNGGIWIPSLSVGKNAGKKRAFGNVSRRAFVQSLSRVISRRHQPHMSACKQKRKHNAHKWSQ